MAQVQTSLTALIEPAVVGLGYELLGIEYLRQGRHSLLRIYIDAVAGESIMLEDCQRISHQISGVLDVEDPIRGHYTLEVSSPGLDRPLFKRHHYERFLGSRVCVRLHVPQQGQRNFTGILDHLEGEHIYLRDVEQDRMIELAFAAIAKANLVPEI